MVEFKMKIIKWIIYETFEPGEIPWVLEWDNNKEGATDEEICWCIQEQIWNTQA